MRVIYYCELCQEIVDEWEIALTEPDNPSIMEMHMEPTLCPDCMTAMGKDEGWLGQIKYNYLH
ncbi:MULTISPECIES: hypothetical protein [Carboxydocella]|uniref:Uncharacterized protein n=2 Tax=Carboxydocella TaxID=178898 RepID=A0A1T4SF38_9FIRM|nr:MULTISPECIES: hypothetical protein [Carboxydocella]AVX19283.1 hypothetical protein CFE_0066 [Carboxydocella thermautotrophica]AVX29698.1 hypothetical protein CTH_0071 [Carboxydocella thermautotrophica]SKA26807.1 hypothetical protein SAMN02745885_02649 [Carboxydocella sporoproducens DSM 16521]GAW27455.1 hypothetical protein ULO1_00250 [Carboxydocella sp. ULO1]GAW30354.1 hypothetical protein JDF658_01190 [Carboxydocella sp. JDF658]